MYIYEYIEVKMSGILATASHREVIDEYSQKGWRFVGAIPNRTGSYGQLKSNDLVFERYIESSSES